MQTRRGWALFDLATTEEDVTERIIPFLKEAEVPEEKLRYVFLSHTHRDHAGGLDAFLQRFPNVGVICGNKNLKEEKNLKKYLYPSDGELFMDSLQVFHVPGHTADSIVVLDIRTKTLITGDSLQHYGIFGSGKWAANIGFAAEHLAAVEKIRALGAERITAAHDFHPYGDFAEGKEAVEKYLDACGEALARVKTLIEENPALSDEEIAEAFSDGGALPKMGPRVPAAVRKAMEA